MHEKQKELVKMLAKECGSLDDIQNLLKKLFELCGYVYHNLTYLLL